MVQIRFHQKRGIQEKMVEVLKDLHTHGMVVFAWASRPRREYFNSTIDPLIIVSDDMPDQDKFIDEFYALCDKYMHLKETKENFEKTGQLTFT